MAKLIKNWDDLNGLENENYVVRVDTNMGCGWIVSKKNIDERNKYLSTHTFYGSCCEGYEKILRDCGFDIKLKNWDKE